MDRIHFDAAACESLEDYTALEYILLGDLRDLLEEPADQFTRSWLIAVLDALLDTLPRQMALKESSGYLSEVLDEYPSWYRHVEDLQNEQRLLGVVAAGAARPSGHALVPTSATRFG